MDQDNQTSNSINFVPNDPAYAPISGQEPAAPSASPAPPLQPTSVSDQINAFGQAQQAVAGLSMTPVAPQEPVAATNPANTQPTTSPQFAQPLPAQNLETMPMVPPAPAATTFTQPTTPAQTPAIEPIPTPLDPPAADLSTAEPVLPLPQSPIAEPATPTPTVSTPTTATSNTAKKTSFKSLFLLVGVFILLFGLALLIGYSLGFKAGQASMPGM